jgi:8-oxo-dGTP diphosphatase
MEEIKDEELIRQGIVPPSFYRVSVKALVVSEGKVLLIEDVSEGKPTWELPGGGMDFGETPHETIKREVDEECGLEVLKIAKYPTYIIPVLKQNSRGLKEFYSLLVCYRAEFSSLDIRPSEECQRVQFFSKEDMDSIALSVHSSEFIKYFDPKDFEEAS